MAATGAITTTITAMYCRICGIGSRWQWNRTSRRREIRHDGSEEVGMGYVMLTVRDVLPYLLVLAGGYLFWFGLSAWIRGSRQFGEPGGRLLRMVQGFRIGIIGLAVIGIGIWLVTGATWVLILSLAVAGEEILETSFIIWAIRSDPRLHADAAPQS
ncbi:hypothetical protein BH23CHL2_BH23CHL2_09040 [soil metagenome]